jgi:hypothetical protein
MARVSAAFRVPYHRVEPIDPFWGLADERTRAAFRKEVVKAVLAEKDRDLAAGLDRRGRRMKRISEWTRLHRRSEMGKADPDAPPLTPAHGLSRTRAYLDGRALADEAEFFWRGGWGRILHFHRIGAGRLPVRDVIGVSDMLLARVQNRMEAWWKAYRAGVVEQAERDAERFRVVVPSRAPARREPPRSRRKAVATPVTPKVITYHTRREPEAPADFSTGWRQFRVPGR